MGWEQEIPPSCLLRVCLHGPFEVYRRATDGTWESVEKEAWGKGRSTRSVFKRLLVAPGRRLSRGAIQDDLWPNTENFELIDKHIYNAINLIRRITGKTLVSTFETTYEIAGQALVWVDLEACETLLKEAENQGNTSPHVLPLLERALLFLERGELLEGEEGTWVYGVRKKSEDMLRQCRFWLAENYEAQDKLWQAGEQYRAMVLADPRDEEALQRWLEMLSRHGKQQEALRCYQDMKDLVKVQGFSFSSKLEQIAVSLNEQSYGVSLVPPLKVQSRRESSETQDIDRIRHHFLESSAYAAEFVPLFPSPDQIFQSIALSKQMPGKHGINISLSHHIFLDSSLLDRLERVFKPHTMIDPTMLDRLKQGVFELKKLLVQGRGIHWPELLITASNQLRFLINLFESHTGISQQFTTLVGETCLLIGDVLFNMQDYQPARRYYEKAWFAAQEASNTTLQAIVAGRYSLLLVDSHQSHWAQPLLNEALRLAELSSSSLIISWLWTVKAEAHATSGEEKLCLQALESAKEQLDQHKERENCYTFVSELAPFVYEDAKLLGYEGSCYLHLKQPLQAQRTLAISQKSSSHPHHQSLVIADFALTLTQQKAPREASSFAVQALTYIQQTRSIRAFRRVLAVRKALHPWYDLSEVKDLSEKILLFTKEGV